ncbi:MAG TPA: DUF4352 domain-containing protein [Candidatus Polarisedimenticolia bacterium]|nr:DUF4352 domain-containing protein [Candidatus Polarisedimenticolia bacterium]
MAWKDATAALLALAAVASTAATSGCAADPFGDYVIDAVELRKAPKLEFLRARVGMVFFEVRFEFENRSDEPLTLKALDFSLKDSAGTLYPFSAQVLDLGQERGFATATLEPGARRPGSVVFQIPAEAVPTALIYRQEVGGGMIVRLASGG